jgi:ATP-dependent 26S proteasome regulatory subunit
MRAIVQNAFWFAERRGDNEIRQKDFQMASKKDAKTINKKETGEITEKKGEKLALN